MAHKILKPEKVHPTTGYSHAAIAGNTLYIAGQIANDVNGSLIGEGNFEKQVRQVYQNLSDILEEAKGSLQNIIKMTTFLTHYSYIETFRSIRSEYFSEPYPPNTLLIVESLALPEYMIEVEAIAILD